MSSSEDETGVKLIIIIVIIAIPEPKVLISQLVYEIEKSFLMLPSFTELPKELFYL